MNKGPAQASRQRDGRGDERRASTSFNRAEIDFLNALLKELSLEGERLFAYAHDPQCATVLRKVLHMKQKIEKQLALAKA